MLLKNNAGEGHHWLGLRLQGTACNRDAIGAIMSWSAGGQKRSRLKTGGGSYLSSHDPREVLGLGTATTIDWVEIKWPRAQRPGGTVHRPANRSDMWRLSKAKARSNLCRPSHGRPADPGIARMMMWGDTRRSTTGETSTRRRYVPDSHAAATLATVSASDDSVDSL